MPTSDAAGPAGGSSASGPERPEDESGLMDLADLRERLAFIARRGWQETRQTVLVTLAQAQRLVAYARGLWTAWRLERKYLAAKAVLGERLAAENLGDPDLQSRVAELFERRKSLLAAKASTRSLDAERRGLYVRLAEPFLESVEAPPPVAQEHRQALALRMEIADQTARQAERRAQLFPHDSATAARVAAGFGIAAVLVCLLLVAVFGGTDPSDVLVPPSLEMAGLQPASALEWPADGASAAETRQVDLDADAYFPRRTATVPLVNGKPEGEVRFVDSQGRVVCLEYYRHGVLNGTRKSYYPSGQKFNELHFVDGVAQGSDTTWFENGTLAAVTDVVDGRPHGRSVMYFPNGRKCTETMYVLGKPHGQRYHYRPDGVCFAIVEWKDGAQHNPQFLLETTAADRRAIEERAAFSLRLKDYWK